MSLIAFINKNTFEIKDDLDDYIYCDYEIRNVIATLNKKGYKTIYSCAGHNELGLMWPTRKESINDFEKYLEEAKTDKALHFIKKDNDYFYHKDELVSTYPYILFQSNYNFTIYPSSFTYELIDDKSYLYKKINFFKDENHTIRKTDEEIYIELEGARKDLENWVDKLPMILDHI